MKNISPLCSLIVLLLVSFSIQAQQRSAGVRMGASYWMDHTSGSCFTNSGLKGQNMTWDKELFYRHQTAGHWAFEGSLGHYAFNNNGGFKDAPDNTTPGYLNTGIHEKSQNIELTVSAQYDISCPAMQKCAVLKKLKSYAGVSLSPTWSRSTTEFTYTKINDFSPLATQRTDNEVNLWAGLSHTLVYDVCSRFTILSEVSWQIQPDRFFEKHSGVSSVPDSRIGWQLGVGYKL